MLNFESFLIGKADYFANKIYDYTQSLFLYRFFMCFVFLFFSPLFLVEGITFVMMKILNLKDESLAEILARLSK